LPDDGENSSFRNAAMTSLYGMSLEECLLMWGRKQGRVRASGDCLLLSLQEALSFDLSQEISLFSLRTTLEDYSVANAEDLVGYWDRPDVNSQVEVQDEFITAVRRFLYKKQYNTTAGDIMIRIAALALKVKIHLIHDTMGELLVLTFSPEEDKKTTPTIYLHLKNHPLSPVENHYSPLLNWHYEDYEVDQLKAEILKQKQTTLAAKEKEEKEEKPSTQSTQEIRHELCTLKAKMHQMKKELDQTDEEEDETCIIVGSQEAGGKDNPLIIQGPQSPDSFKTPTHLPKHLGIPSEDNLKNMCIEDSEDEEVKGILEEHILQHTRKYQPKHPENLELGLTYRDAFPFGEFFGMEPEEVDMVPDMVDGKAFFIIRNSGNPTKASQDSHHWNLKPTSVRRSEPSFRGRVKVGWCKGGAICPHQDCAFVLQHPQNKANSHAFTSKNIGGTTVKLCKTCKKVAAPVPCSARKYVKINTDTKDVLVYHYGSHSCTPLPTRRKEQKIIEEVVKDLGDQNLKQTPKQLRLRMVGNSLRSGHGTFRERWAEALDQADIWGHSKQVENAIRKYAGPAQNSLDAIATLKVETDTQDKFLIYKIQDGRMTNSNTFVFCTSEWAVDLALKMDVDNPNPNPMQQQAAFFDSCKSRCQGKFEGAALWAYHPPARKLVNLCKMYMEGENTLNLTTFFELWNLCLKEASKDQTTLFNPCQWMCDEGGANFTSLFEVYGVVAVSQKVTTCTLHYMKSVKKYSAHFEGEDKKTFNKLAVDLLEMDTAAGYLEVREQMLELCKNKKELKHWCKWWNQRRYHLFHAFKGTAFSGANMSEVGNASWVQFGKNKTLLDCMFDDMARLILTFRDINNYMEGISSQTGKAPTSQERGAKDRRRQVRRALQMGKDLKNIEALEKHVEEGTRTDFFMPLGSASHRPKGTSEQGKFLKTEDNYDRRSTPSRASIQSSTVDSEDEDSDEDIFDKEILEDVKGIETPRKHAREEQDVKDVQAGLLDLQDEDVHIIEEEDINLEEGLASRLARDRREPGHLRDFKTASHFWRVDLQKKTRGRGGGRGGRGGRGSRGRGRGRGGTPGQGPGQGPQNYIPPGPGAATFAEPFPPERQGDLPLLGIGRTIPTQAELQEKVRRCQSFVPGAIRSYHTPLSRRPEDLPQHPVEVVTPSKGVSRCQGCHQNITAPQKKATLDLVFKQWNIPRWGDQQPRFEACYMHLKINCMRALDGRNKVHNITTTDEQLMKLTDDQLVLLNTLEVLPYILLNKM
jgi:hypothetical protein